MICVLDWVDLSFCSYRRYVEALLLLNSPVQAWFWYKQARTCQLERLVRAHFCVNERTPAGAEIVSDKKRSFKEMANSFPTFIELASGLIARDYDYIRSDYFTTVTNAQVILFLFLYFL